MTSFSPPLLVPRSGALPVKFDDIQYFVNLQCTDLRKLVKEVGGEAEGQEGLPRQKHIVAPGNRIGLMAKGASNPPDGLPEVGDEDEGVGESQQGGKSSAMENLWIWTAFIARGWNGQYKLLKMMKSVRTNNVGSPESSVGPPSAAQKLVKNNYNSDGDGGREGRFQFSQTLFT